MYLGNDIWLERTIKFIRYYREIKDLLGWEKIYFSDNGSSLEMIQKIEKEIGFQDIEIIHHENSLISIKGHSCFDYPECWRVIDDIKKAILDGYEKIIFIDTDFFVLSEKMTEWVKSKNDGWSTVYCNKFSFPEAAFGILCKSAFSSYLGLTKTPYLQRNEECLKNNIPMENILPFTYIERDMLIGDRYGEYTDQGIDQTPDMDFYAQCKRYTKMTFQYKK